MAQFVDPLLALEGCGDAAEEAHELAHFLQLITNSFALPATKEEQARFFGLVRESLAPGGTVVIKDFEASMMDDEAFAGFHCPSLAELREAFAGREIEQAARVEVPPHEADPSGRTRTAALLQARRPR